MHTMKISNDLATSLAYKLLNTRISALQSRKAELIKFITPIVIDSIPESVMKAFKEFPAFLQNKSQVVLGFPSPYYNYNLWLDNPLPCSDKHSLSNATEEQRNYIVEEITFIEKEDKELGSLKKQLINTIYSLSTKNNVVKFFPELTHHFPEKQERFLPTQMKQLRDQLQLAELPNE